MVYNLYLFLYLLIKNYDQFNYYYIQQSVSKEDVIEFKI